MSTSTARRPTRVRIAFITAIAFGATCLAFNFAEEWLNTVIYERTPGYATRPLMSIIAGIAAGEIGALALSVVWLNGSLLARIAGAWSVGALAAFTIAIGRETLLADRSTNRSELLIALAQLPLVSLCLQLPMWWMRIYLHWRIAPRDQQDLAETRNSLSIRDILVGTAVVAITFALARLSAGYSEMGVQFWIAWLIAAAILFGIGQLVLMPLVVLILRCSSAFPGIAFVVIAPIVFPLALAIFYVLSNVIPPAGVYLAVYLLPLTSLAVASAPLWFMRLAGYRLVMGRAISSTGPTSVKPPGEIP